MNGLVDRAALAAVVGLALALGPRAAAPLQDVEAPVGQATQTAPIPPAQVAAHALALRDTAAAALRAVEGLADLGALRAEVERARIRQQELAEILDAFGAVEHTRPERFLNLRDVALAQEQSLQQTSQALGRRLTELAEVRAAWLERLAEWEALQRPDLGVPLSEVEASLTLVREALDRTDGAVEEVAALAAETRELLAGTRQLVDRVAALRAGRREGLLRATEPFLLSPAHLASLREPPDWGPGEALQPGMVSAFAREHAGLLLLHLVVALALGLLARRLAPLTAPEGGWSGLLHHPWAFGVFAATVFLARRYVLAPPVWDAVTWSLLAASGAVLASALLRALALRVVFVAAAVVYPLLLLAEGLRLPAPWFRLALAGAAAAALAAFLLLAARADAATESGRRARLLLALPAALAAAVLLAQVLGFDPLSRWIMHGVFTSAYVVLAVAFLVLVARGALRTLLRQERLMGRRLVGTVAVPLAERLMTLLQALLVIGGVLVLLDVWEVAPSPAETWRRVVSWGFSLAGLQITVGRVLLAAFLVYLTVIAAWLVRTVVDEEVTRGWSVERGVAESINALVRYALITLGVLLGLAALGVELQNFAIVAGALGVGIGFGLQNVVNNFVSGLILLFERPVRVGDTVEIDGEWGMIKKIGLRSTVVVTFTRAELIVPNGVLISEKVTNWTLSDPVTRLALPVGVAYGSDVEKVLRILEEAGRVHAAVAADPPPAALFMGFGDNSLDFELRIWVVEIRQRLVARSAVLAEVDRRFREEEIEIPFPQRDLHIRSLDAAVAGAFRPSPLPAHEVAEG